LRAFVLTIGRQWGVGKGSLCNPKKKKERKKSDRREDDLWLAQIFSSSSLGNFHDL